MGRKGEPTQLAAVNEPLGGLLADADGGGDLVVPAPLHLALDRVDEEDGVGEVNVVLRVLNRRIMVQEEGIDWSRP